jgi:hypothetical protein
MEDVVVGDPIKLGYLTVWAAHYLLTGQHFRPAPTRSAARSASSGTTPSTRSCGSASRSPSPRRTSRSTRTGSSGRRVSRVCAKPLPDSNRRPLLTMNVREGADSCGIWLSERLRVDGMDGRGDRRKRRHRNVQTRGRLAPHLSAPPHERAAEH